MGVPTEVLAEPPLGPQRNPRLQKRACPKSARRGEASAKQRGQAPFLTTI